MNLINIKDGQFKTFDYSFGSYVVGKVVIAGKRFLKWGPNGLEGEQVCHQDHPIPEDWSFAYDLDVTVNGVVYRVTIFQAAIPIAFQPYLNMLAADNCRIEEVETRITASTSKAGRTSLKFSLA